MNTDWQRKYRILVHMHVLFGSFLIRQMILTNIDNHLISTFHKIYGLNNISIFGKQDVKEIPSIYKWQLKNINFLFIFWI